MRFPRFWDLFFESLSVLELLINFSLNKMTYRDQMIDGRDIGETKAGVEILFLSVYFGSF